MTAEERRRQTRERVREWKKNPGKQWSLRQQRKRRYARGKAKVAEKRRGVQVRLRIIEPEGCRQEQETFLEDPAFTEGDREVVRSHYRSVEKRSGKQYRGVGEVVAKMEPEHRGGQSYGNIKSMGEAGEPGVGAADPGRPEGRTENEKRTYAKFDELRARKARGELGPKRRGVEAPIVWD